MRLWLLAAITCLYLFSGTAFWHASRQASSSLFRALATLIIACLVHAILLIDMIDTIGEGNEPSFNLSICNVISLFAWAVACVSLIWLWKRQMALGGVLISVINALLVPVAALFTGNKPFIETMTGGMIWHILLSIAAWTVLTIALIHEALYSYLFQRLKRKRLKNTNLASLASLERIMMVYTVIGWVLLLASLFSGWFFVEDLFAQHLWHKTVLTMLSGVAYGWLVWLGGVRRRHGMVLVYWSLLGYALLATGYVVSNMIVQFVMH